MKTIKPLYIDDNFGVGCAEENLDHITISPTYDPDIALIVQMSKINPGNRVNWIDAYLPVMAVMRDKAGNEIEEECTGMSCRIEAGNITLVIEDNIGYKAKFELGKAEVLWPELANERVLIW